MSQRTIYERVRRPRIESWYLVSFLAVGVGLPLLYLNQPLHFDEAIYLVIAQQMAEGGTLYVDVTDHKPPGIFLAGALAFEVSPQPHSLLRLATYGATAVSGVLVFAFGRVVRDRWTGLVGSVLFLLITYMPHFDGFFFMTEPWSVVCLMAAALLFFADRPSRDALAGVALGFGVLFNQTVFLFGAVVIAFLAFKLRYPGNRTRAYLLGSVRRLLTIGLGFAVPVSVTLAAFAARGTLDALLYSVVVLPATSYSTPFELYGHLLAALTLLPVWLLAGGMAAAFGLAFVRGRPVSDGILFTTLWAVVLSVPGATSFAGDHKMLFAFPAIALLTALGIREVRDRFWEGPASLLANVGTVPSRSTVVTVVLVVTVVAAAGANLKHGTTRLSDDISTEMATAERVDEHVAGPVYVFSPQNGIIYFSEDSSPATSWLGQPYSDALVERTIDELRSRENPHIVVRKRRVSGDEIINDPRYYRETKEPLVAHLNENYEPTARTEGFVVFERTA
jgi:hypothetical protein